MRKTKYMKTEFEYHDQIFIIIKNLNISDLGNDKKMYEFIQNLRIIQKDVVYVIGLPFRLSKPIVFFK